MNILDNKNLLHGLLQQGDMLNTINGGGAMTYVEEQVYDDHFVLTFWAPTVPAEAFNVILNTNTLVVFSLLASTYTSEAQGAFNIPTFFRKFTLPDYADAEHIEAIHEDNRLSIIVPYKKGQVPLRKINIKHNNNNL